MKKIIYLLPLLLVVTGCANSQLYSNQRVEQKIIQPVFCSSEPCGPTPDGGNTCLDRAQKQISYYECENNSDCPTGLACTGYTDCFEGDAIGQKKSCQ